VADPNAIRGKWMRGRVMLVFPGDDGLVRNVSENWNRRLPASHYEDLCYSSSRRVLRL